MHAAYGDTTRIVGVVQRSDQHLRRTLQLLGSRDMLQDAVQQRTDVVRRLLPVIAHPSVLGRSVDDGEVQLVFRSVQAEHQVEHHLIHLFGAAVGLVHLVHHHDGLQSYLEGLLQHKARLRHGSLKGIHQQDASVGHVEHALHLAAEVAVSRRIYNVDFRILIVDRHIFGQDGNASFAFQIVVIQH